ncbi:MULTISPECIES: O-antigen ligase family protein [Acidaminococcus]|uniref:O-antigen ligase family protein n=1 Tax=Acidaminococcus TaxID=904 RepID=UPI0026DAA4C2|nr:O-antigen ligase family protein [Acidaminococcus massiliensis]
MSSENRLQWLLMAATNLYLFFLCSTKWNAGYSISLGLVVAAILIYWKRKRKIAIPVHKVWLWCYGLFMGLIFLAAAASGKTVVMKSAVNFISYSIPFWVLVMALQYKRKPIRAYMQWGLWGGTLVLCGVAFHQHVLQNFPVRLQGPFPSPNNFALALECLLPFLGWLLWDTWKKSSAKWQWLGVIPFACAGLSLWMTRSRGGMAGALIGWVMVSAYYWMLQQDWNRKRLVAVFLVLLCVVGAGTAFSTINLARRKYDGERLLLWKASYAMWMDHPAIGVGFGQWSKEYKAHYILPQAKEPDLPNPHNNIITFFSTAGFLGGIGYLCFAVGTIMLLLGMLQKEPGNYIAYAVLWLCLADFIHGMVDNTLYSKSTMRIYFAMWGIFLASSIKSWEEGFRQ